MVKSPKKKIIILGAGFAGLNTALRLSKLLKEENHEIILIDKLIEHLYTPDLYEIATAYNKRITDSFESNLKKTVVIPIPQLIKKTKIKFFK